MVILNPPLSERQDALLRRIAARKAIGEHEGQPFSGLQYALDECIELEEKLILAKNEVDATAICGHAVRFVYAEGERPLVCLLCENLELRRKVDDNVSHASFGSCSR